MIVTVAVVFAGIFNEASAFLAGILWVPVLSAVLATVLTAVFGVTAGKALVGIRVVHARTGGRPGFWAVPRSLVIVAPLLITIATATVLAEIPQDSGYSRLLDSLFLPLLFLPAVLWLVLLLVLAVRPRHRGLQDLAGNSVVVQRTGVPRTVARDSGR